MSFLSALGSIGGYFIGGPAGAAIGGSIGGAIDSSNAADDASEAQQQSAEKATTEQRRQYDLARADQSPYRQAGSAGLTQLQRMLGITTPADHSEANFDAAKFMPYAPDAQRYMNEHGVSAYDYYKADGSRAPGDFWKQTDPGVTASDPGFNSLNKPFDFQADPGYQFRMDEGMKGVTNSAAARGGLLSGAALKAASTYNQNFASNEYGNAYNRDKSQKDTSFNRLASLAGIGQTATNSLQQAGSNMANNVSENMIGAGNARASGYIGRGNAINGGIGQAYNMYQGQQFMNRLGGGGGGGGSNSGGYIGGLNDFGRSFASNYTPENYG